MGGAFGLVFLGLVLALVIARDLRRRPRPEPPAWCAWCRWRDGSECTHPESPARGRLLVDVCSGAAGCELRELRP